MQPMKKSRLLANLESHSILQISLFLLTLFIAIYSLTYSGTFLTDDEQILASRTFSLAFDKQINDTRVYGNTRIFALANLSPEQAAQATNIEPLQELAGLPLARLAELFHLGLVQTIFLLNIWVVAITAVVVFSSVLIDGYSRSTALVISLLFGLGTQVWVYTRTYFRDPLAMLCLTLAWVCAQKITRNINDHRKAGTSWLAWLGLIVALASGILTKNTISIAVPVLLAWIILNTGRYSVSIHSLGKMTRRSWKTFLVIIPILMILGILWLFVLPRLDLFARFTPAYYLFLVRFFFSTPHPALLEALVGPFISPGKSIFLYSPLLILSVLALIRHPKTAWPAWAYLCLLILGQALFYDADWWGHRNWGLRFILPAIPPLMIASAPIIDKWLHSVRHQVDLILISLVSVLIQVIGVLPLLLNYYVDVANASPSISDHATVWTAKFSPILYHMNWILRGKPFDLASVRTGSLALPIIIGLAVIIFLVILGLGLVKWRWLAPVSLGLIISLTILMVAVYAKDPAYYPSREDLKAAQDMVAQQYLPGDLVLVKAYVTPAWDYWMNWGNPRVPWTALSYYFPRPDLITTSRETNDPAIAMDNVSLSLLSSIPGTYRRVWLVLPSDSPGSDLDLEATWLENNSESSNEWSFPGEEVETRLFLFTLPVQ